MILQDAWEDVDPDELSYEVNLSVLPVYFVVMLPTFPFTFYLAYIEHPLNIHLFQELLALGEVVGTESRGLSTDTLASLPSVNFKMGSDQHGSNDSYV